MAEPNENNDRDQISNGQSNASAADIHPVVVEDDDFDDENGGREPIDLSGEVLDPKDLAELLRARPRRPVRPAVENAPQAPATQPAAAGEQAAAPEQAAADQAASAEREAELLAEIENQKNNYLRAVADLHNFRRRTEEEIKRIRANANERLIKDILPLVDDLDLCIDAAKKTESYEQLISGVEAINRKFQDILSKEGVQPVAAVGEVFNPDIHEAVMLDPDSESPDDTVTDQLRKGYTLHGRLIRPALVKVAKS